KAFVVKNASELRLEAVLNAELHDARRGRRAERVRAAARHRRDATERAGVEIRLRIAPVEGVEQVEDLHSELQVLRRRDRDEPRQREIDLPESRPGDAVALVRSKRAWIRLRECCPIQIVVQRLVAVYVVGDLIGALIGLAVERSVASGEYGEPAS